ncbi:hypothetical protein LU604_05015 [Erwinia tracheiphila]|uniref:hypothetical protein n=1 Tax=Erwinia tracheiphila TaxID=65700 RepID=UPI001F39C9C9|nr:hypothetical protein [Erwinia tracheiphila]UIA84370.1 hypothetical protein LU604_05015 [Erwinia tracheiphila]UIA92950.1 hypothetical protein LU632_04945 [Erwinia tracheiphila]
MSEMKITGIVLAKTNFYLFSINAYGKPAGKIKLSRSNLLNWLVQQHGYLAWVWRILQVGSVLIFCITVATIMG